jgi:GrpB-like predicted nucleotidyltransferase (UPF0157 family)
MNDAVVIVEYDPEWPGRYEKESGRVREAAGDLILAVEHIGSTAVPALAAKPIVDIMAGVAGRAEAEALLGSLAAIGYDDVTRQPPEEADWFFCLGNHPAPNEGYHVHLMRYPSAFWDRHVLFRDYLRRNADAARAYEDLKRELAVRFRHDRPAYTDAKDDFIEDALRVARKERQE